MEQTKRAKEISKQLEEMEISYKQSCPYTSSWKSDEAIIEINSFKSKLDAVKEEASENEVERYTFPRQKKPSSYFFVQIKLISISALSNTQQHSIKFHIQPSRRVSRKDQGA